MQLNSSGDDLLYMGIDGGGSKCRATLVSSADELLGTGVAGPANPFQDEQQAFDSVMESARLALEDAGLAIEDSARVVAGVGLAGVNLPRFYDLVQQWEHPFKQMFLATDLHIACLGAHDGQDGAVMVAGTGSQVSTVRIPVALMRPATASRKPIAVSAEGASARSRAMRVTGGICAALRSARAACAKAG